MRFCWVSVIQSDTEVGWPARLWWTELVLIPLFLALRLVTFIPFVTSSIWGVRGDLVTSLGKF